MPGIGDNDDNNKNIYIWQGIIMFCNGAEEHKEKLWPASLHML